MLQMLMLYMDEADTLSVIDLSHLGSTCHEAWANRLSPTFVLHWLQRHEAGRGCIWFLAQV